MTFLRLSQSLGRSPRLAAMFLATLFALVVQTPAAWSQQRPRLEGGGSCAGVEGRYLAALAGGRAILVSADEFPGASRAGSGLGDVTTHTESLWRMDLGEIPVGVSGCVAFDKDHFTWTSDLATYVQYLAKDLLASAQQHDPTVRTLAIGERSVRLEVSRPGIDTAVLSGPEGALLGYGRLSDAQRYLFLPVLVGGDDKLLVRIFRNDGQPFGTRSTEFLGSMLVAANAAVMSETTPVFQLRWLESSN